MPRKNGPGREYSYRRLDSRDVGLLKGMLGVFGEAFEDPHTYQGAVPGDDYLRSLLGKPHFIALAALDAGRVVGGLAAYVLEKFEQDRKEVYIYDLAVANAHRRRGVATGLIESLRRLARELGAYVIYVQADRGDRPAIRLYESLGTREDVHHFDIEVR
jgi:aminoglycoside 3-N-acetyltransferase I